jgi:hypothetical protein
LSDCSAETGNLTFEDIIAILFDEIPKVHACLDIVLEATMSPNSAFMSYDKGAEPSVPGDA